MLKSINDTAHSNVRSEDAANYPVGKRMIGRIHLSEDVVAKARFSEGQRLDVEIETKKSEGGLIEIVDISVRRSATGPKLQWHRGRWLVQVSNRCSTPFPSTPMVAVVVRPGVIQLGMGRAANDNLTLEPKVSAKTARIKTRLTPTMLESLSVDPGWERRLAMLAGNDNVRTTSAGDQCYTAGFIIDLALRAANRIEFDLDVCSMQNNGRYDQSVEVTERSWGSTPQQFRRDECVVKHVPSKRYFTNDRPYGSLARVWDGDFIWLNPPYSLRAWATFLEYAHIQVDNGDAGIILALVPCDNNGPHNRHLYGEHAYRIEITRQIPFFKREKCDRDGNVKASNIIDVIRGNQFVVFGKGPKVKTFLSRFLRELKKIDYITEQHEARYISMFGLDGGRGSRKSAA